MKKLLLIPILLLSICTAFAQAAPKSIKKATATKWKAYTNTKYGFAFQYPAAWAKQGKETEVVDRNGKVTAVEANFADTNTHTTLLVAYHLPPNGITLYQYAVEQAKANSTNTKQIKIGTVEAIQTTTTRDVDGRGNKLTVPTQNMVVDFMDVKKVGEVQVQFSTPANLAAKQTLLLNRLLATFKFTN